MPTIPSKEATPTKSVRSRMGTLLRRSSSAISFTRPGSASRRASQESLKIEASAPEASLKLPSPVPESPMVEAGASQAAAGPSPLAAPPVTASAPIDIPQKAPTPGTSWGDGPVTVTPDKLPASSLAAKSYEDTAASDTHIQEDVSMSRSDRHTSSDDIVPMVSSVSKAREPASPRAAPQQLEIPLMPPEVNVQAPTPTADELDSTHKAQEPPEPAVDPAENPELDAHEPEALHSASIAIAEAIPHLPANTEEGDPHDPIGIVGPPPADLHSISHNPWAPPEPAVDAVHADAHVVSGGHTHTYFDPRLSSIALPNVDDRSETAPQSHNNHFSEVATSVGQNVDTPRRSRTSTMSSQARPLIPPLPASASDETSSKVSVAPSANDHTEAVIIVEHEENGPDLPSIIGSHDSPFVDAAVGRPEAVYFRRPAAFDPTPEIPTASIAAAADSTSQSGAHKGAAKHSLLADSDLDETSPLLDSHSVLCQHSAIYDPSVTTNYEQLGWRAHILPDTSVYYTHPGLHVVTDMDLRQIRTVREVSEYLGRVSFATPRGWETWLRRSGQEDSQFLEHFWVHHDKRSIVTPSSDMSTSAEDNAVTEAEKLNIEKAYWRYVEAHPGHLALSAEAIGEATDTLTWAYSERLLPSTSALRGKHLAFSEHECQELSHILRSLNITNSPSNTTVRTHVVAKIMLRMCLWRLDQLPLSDFNQDRTAEQSRSHIPMSRRVVDVVVTALCLGIPIFFSSRPSRVDHGGARVRSAAGSMLVIGAVACMIAAVILGASVTLVSIPDLNELSRIASFISIVLSASSLVSAILALFQWKAAIERHSTYDIPGEGMLFISKRSVLLSLPLVFLIWAIAAFVAGVALHMSRGFFINSSSLHRNAQKYVQWAAVGTVGGIVGMLFACGLILL